MRYVVRRTPDRRAFGIADRRLWGWCCTIQDEHHNRLPLEFPTREAAEAWLRKYMKELPNGPSPFT